MPCLGSGEIPSIDESRDLNTDYDYRLQINVPKVNQIEERSKSGADLLCVEVTIGFSVEAGEGLRSAREVNHYATGKFLSA